MKTQCTVTMFITKRCLCPWTATVLLIILFEGSCNIILNVRHMEIASFSCQLRRVKEGTDVWGFFCLFSFYI